jgi:MoxR-like ATPase
MAERQVTVDGVTREVPKPFLLLATENPIEHEGTFPLPEAQLDRFFLKTGLGYPHGDDELRIIRDQHEGHPLGRLGHVVDIDEIELLQLAVRDIYVDEILQRWLIDLVRATRELEPVAVGASVRGSLALERAVRAWALIHERDYVVPEDVHELFLPVVGHRVLFTPAFLVEARKLGQARTMEELRRLCLERAPRPEAEPEAKVVPITGS